MEDKVYKVFTKSEWKIFQEIGQFSGSADDLSDGFIHLSSKEQVAGVIEKFFTGKHPLFIAEFSNPEFLKRIEWEVSFSNETYPHLYGSDLLVSELSGLLKL